MIPLLLMARLGLFGVFALSGFAKILNLRDTRRAIADFGVPDGLARAGAWALPLAELGIAAMMLGRSSAWWGSLGALALLASFSAAIGLNLRRGRTPDCHCFGQWHSEPVSAGTLARNGLFAGPAVVILAGGWSDPGPGVAEWILGLTESERVLALICLGLAASIVVMAIRMRSLVRQVRNLAESVAAVEGAVDARETDRLAKVGNVETPSGLPLGVIAPEAELTARAGNTVSLRDLVDGPGRIALVFVSPLCPPCRELLPMLAQRAADRSPRLRLVVVASGTREENARLLAEHQALDIYLTPDKALAAAYRAKWTPAAVVVSHGRIASATRFGPGEIDGLLAAAASGEPLVPADSPVGGAAPQFTGVDETGAPITNAIFAHGPTVLLYWSATCRYCAAIADDVEGWAARRSRREPRLALVTRTPEQIPGRLGADVVIVEQGESSVASLFGMAGTPSAVLVDAGGALASAVCVGAQDVKALLGVTREAAAADSRA